MSLLHDFTHEAFAACQECVIFPKPTERISGLFLLYFDVVWQVDVFYRLEVIFEVFTTAS